MVAFILLFILSVGSQVGASTDLDAAFQSFLKTSPTEGSRQNTAAVVQNLFQQYQTKFNRVSTTSAEEKIRFAAFNETIHALQKDYQEGPKTYTVGLNELSDKSLEDLNKMLGVQVPKDNSNSASAKSAERILPVNENGAQSKSAALPSSYDLTVLVVGGTNTPILNPVKDQGQCGSCYAFAFVTLLEAQYAFQLKSAANLSEQQIVDCSKSDLGCNGGYFTNTFSYIKTNLWQSNSEVSYPYKAAPSGSCKFKSVGGGGVKFGALGYLPVTANSATAMQQALLSYGPLWVSVYVGDSATSAGSSILHTFSSYKSGVFQPPACPTSLYTTNHAVVIVGYGVDPVSNLPYWKVRNSWNSQWGNKGYFLIQRGVNMCGIESQAFAIGKLA